MKKVKVVEITDWNQYESGLCCNGGRYSFTERYTKVSGGYEVTYFTSSDFDYCRFCGTFHNDNGKCPCGEIPQVVSAKELERRIEEAEADPENFTIEREEK